MSTLHDQIGQASIHQSSSSCPASASYLANESQEECACVMVGGHLGYAGVQHTADYHFHVIVGGEGVYIPPGFGTVVSYVRINSD